MTELEQKLLAENAALKREVDEFRRKLKLYSEPRVEYVDEKTRRFRDVLYKKHESTGYYMKISTLHVDIYKFYHGLDDIPKNCLIHHDGKDENGKVKKRSEDDIQPVRTSPKKKFLPTTWNITL